MANPRIRRALTLIEVVVAIVVVLIVLYALLSLLLNQLRESARSNMCLNRMHQIGIALQTYHGAYKSFPALSTQPFPQTPGGPEAGFSWLVQLFPFMEETELYRGIANASGNLQPIADGGKGPFDPSMVDASGRALATYRLDALICPSFRGDPFSDLSQKPPYAAVKGQNLQAVPPIGVAISNYVAIPATHIQLMKDATADVNDADGVIVPNVGIRLREIKDGSSHTFIACESRERGLSAWIDGSINWVVGANPNNAAVPTTDDKGHLMLPPGNTTAINIGPNTSHSDSRYLTQANSPNGLEWSWGPSSEHSGGSVKHIYADASVRSHTDKIDPTVYLWLITRAGGEPVVDPQTND